MSDPQETEAVDDNTIAVELSDDKVVNASSCSKTRPSKGSYTAVVPKLAEEGLGLELDLLDGVSALVMAVGAGAVRKWNERQVADGGRGIQENDRIVEVNGQRGNSAQLALLLQQEGDAEATLVVNTPSLNLITLHNGGVSLGVDLEYHPEGITLLISKVSNQGLLREWNDLNRCDQVTVRDRIVAVNGYTGSSRELLRQLKDLVKAGAPLEVSILRFPT